MNPPTTDTAVQLPGLPLVTQLGFAGSRMLFDAVAYPNVDSAVFIAAVQHYLTERLRKLQTDLGLSERHFFCGMSQLAVGADTLFTRACQTLGWPQRLLLPQPRRAFLDAQGSSGPDFSPAEREAAEALLASPHIIDESRVSDAEDRAERFHDVNLELAKLTDVLVCLVRDDATGKPGGTLELMEIADRRARPVLVIRVSVGPQGLPQFFEAWHHRDNFKRPALPSELAALQTQLTDTAAATDYCDALKAYTSRESQRCQAVFKRCAFAIIGTHVLATAFAAGALLLGDKGLLPQLLGIELALLATGFATHHYLHQFQIVRCWALSRLLSETIRSAMNMRLTGGALTHLFGVPMPASLQPLLHTLNVLHLRDSRSPSSAWEERRSSYIRQRLTELSARGGQIDYYEKERIRARVRSAWAQWPFLICSMGAIVATAVKLFLFQAGGGGLLGFLAIVLPVVAVGALSLAAAFDLEARAHTYGEMLDFLRGQHALLEGAQSERAFRKLVVETEARLLGETASWYARRAFTGVT